MGKKGAGGDWAGPFLRIARPNDKPDVSLRDFFQKQHLLGNPVFTGLIEHGSISPEIRVNEDVCAFLPCPAMQFPGGASLTSAGIFFAASPMTISLSRTALMVFSSERNSSNDKPAVNDSIFSIASMYG
jgi:hypothetical protein